MVILEGVIALKLTTISGHRSSIDISAMDRDPDHESVIRLRTRKSLATMAEESTLAIDPVHTSTDMSPPTITGDRSGPTKASIDKENTSTTEHDRKSDGNLEPRVVPPAPKYLSGASLVVVITCVVVVAWLMFLDSSIIVTAIPAITDEFHSLKDIGWYGSAYHVANAAFQPLTGKIYRYFSSKARKGDRQTGVWSFFAFLVLFEIGSLICGAAPSSVILIVGRVVAGIGSAGIMSGGLTIVAGAVPLERRPGTCIRLEYVLCKVVSLTSSYTTILQLLWVWSLAVSVTHPPGA
ncbi:Putative major facilitator superfamily, MFS transporter superfamily [Colletotrichum destructivum]|uniref:Major facilitator superfamily, MFS transporter superfamily n=1 Tax=Colletotrichum destructivum TaxID=34406 RepID=A0AAX4I6A5_9PEZI|nr:Putative major facilitator superfamily, MFS transporter superfamily [Colletotrichum destructivum]